MTEFSSNTISHLWDNSYDEVTVFDQNHFGPVVFLKDHLLGFDQNFRNKVLDHVQNCSAQDIKVYISYCLHPSICNQYQKLHLEFLPYLALKESQWFANYHVHPELTFEKFICSFNGAPHVSRKMLVAILHKYNWFDCDTCSKNFVIAPDELDGHVADCTDARFYRKFFVDTNSEQFYKSIYSFFGYDRQNLGSNIYNLETKLTKSFLHLVSESLATSYYPFVTEKFLQSVVTRGLFVAYAQPGWHDHLEHHYGFRKYDRIFDYRFDKILNPVERLIELMSMISKFSVLSSDDWRDLYEIEKDTIEFNYDHYFSRNCFKTLQKFSKFQII